MLLLSAVLAGLAVLVLRRPDRGRIARVLPLAAPRPALRRGRPGPAPPAARPSARAPAVACAVGGAAVALLLAVPAGPALGLALALVGPRLLARLEPATVRAERAQLTADLPLVLDLLASCLAGGAALAESAAAVAAAVPGPAGRRLAAVSAQLAVGTAPAQAWAALTGLGQNPGGRGGPSNDAADPLAPAARALGRAAEGGAPVAAVLTRLAADARARSRAEAEVAARRVGVLVVAPLGLCFLPAFVLLGVVPVVAGLVGPLLATF